jgi:uncharacterized protein (TIGR03067 family)
MKRILALILLLGMYVPVLVADPAQDELEKLQGPWKVVSLEKDGKKQSEDAVKTLKITIKEDKFLFKEGDKESEATLKIDPAKKPKTIDLVVKEGDALKTLKGIYQLDGDDLTICAAGDPNGERPTKFATKPKTHVGLLVLKREKP